MEQAPQPRKAESPNDFKAIARSLLGAVSTNETGALGGDLIAAVQAETGYEPAAVAAVFAEMGDQGVIERSMTNPRAGVVLTESGQVFFERFDELMPDHDQ